MKTALFLLTLCFGTSVSANIPHLDLEMDSSEYAALLNNLEEGSQKNLGAKDDQRITAALKMGSRLAAWIAKINEGRTSTTAIRLTSPGTRRGIPIDKPNMYNPTTIGNDQAKNLAEAPSEMRDVLTGTGEIPSTTSLDNETFIKFGRPLDKVYQSAARYKSVNPYRYEYTRAALKDVRGYHYLVTNKITAESLRDVALIEEAKKGPIKLALGQICLNSAARGAVKESKCDNLVEEAFKDNKLAEFYNLHLPNAKTIWDQFFKIPKNARRSDTTWTSTTFTVPFNTPSIPKFTPYLRDNVEDEFRFKEWSLKLNFGTFASGPRLEFQAGVVPHVRGLGGNTIVMDSNQSIEEYESQWTIRHEFGHVIGLPDCYHEFWDSKLEGYVNYQLDISDLMCSRAGDMTERIYNELKEAYAH